MAKTIKNKQYSEFWEDEKLEVKKSNVGDNKNISSDEIKKLEKKLIKKVSGLEKEIKEIKNESTEQIQPVNKPRGWHAKNKFVDDIGNIFSKGVYVGVISESTEKKKRKENKQFIVESDERKMEMPKKTNNLDKIKSLPITHPNKILTEKDVYQQYIYDKIPFKMFFRGNLIFDSKNQSPKNYPKFNDDGFILFGKNYIYRGIRIEKY